MELGNTVRIVLVGLAVALIVLGAAVLVSFVRRAPNKTLLTKQELIKELESSLFDKSYLLEYKLEVYDKSLKLGYSTYIVIDSSGRGALLVQSRGSGSVLNVLILDEGSYVKICKVLKTITLSEPISYITVRPKENADLLALSLGDVPSENLSLYKLLMIPILLGRLHLNGSVLVLTLNTSKISGYAVFKIAEILEPVRIYLFNKSTVVELRLVKKDVYNPLLVDEIARICATSSQ